MLSVIKTVILMFAHSIFTEVSIVYEGVLFAQLLCGATFIAASLFQMDMVNKLF